MIKGAVLKVKTLRTASLYIVKLLKCWLLPWPDQNVTARGEGGVLKCFLQTPPFISSYNWNRYQ